MDKQLTTTNEHTCHDEWFEEKALELIGMIVGAQPHWKFIEKSLIEALAEAEAAGRKSALPHFSFIAVNPADDTDYERGYCEGVRDGYYRIQQYLASRIEGDK
jgi:hypothetical protein